MKEIKFRVYRRYPESKMIYFNIEDLVYKRKPVEVIEEFGGVKNTLMQYTGFKDKNGKKIYEGDILKITDDDYEIDELDSNTGIGTVEWLDQFGFWNITKVENSLGDLNFSYNVEVIGNIYENPELLEAK